MCIDGLRECGVVTNLLPAPNTLFVGADNLHEYVITRSLELERNEIPYDDKIQKISSTICCSNVYKITPSEEECNVAVKNYLHGYSNRQGCKGKLAGLLYRIVEWFKWWNRTSDYWMARNHLETLMLDAHRAQAEKEAKDQPQPFQPRIEEEIVYIGVLSPLQIKMRANAEQRLQEMLTLYNQNLVEFTVYKPKVDINSLTEKAKTFSDSNEAAKFKSGIHYTKGELLRIITRRLKSLEFRSNPQQYIADWKVQRGRLTYYIGPQDEALRFFDQEVMPTII